MPEKRKIQIIALARQFLRFAAVGLTAFAIDFGVLWLLNYPLGVNYLVANVISFTLSTVFNYFASVRWVFDVSDGRSKTKDFVVFVVLSIIGLGLNSLCMYLLVDIAKLEVMLSKILATAIVTMYNFVTRKKYLEN